MMHQCLLSARQLPPIKHESDWEEIEKRTTSSIGAARQKIGKEISELNEKLKVCKEAIQQMKTEIAKLEQQDQEPKDIVSLIPNVVP